MISKLLRKFIQTNLCKEFNKLFFNHLKDIYKFYNSQQDRVLLINGCAGSGKSSLLLAAKLVLNYHNISVCVAATTSTSAENLNGQTVYSVFNINSKQLDKTSPPYIKDAFQVLLIDDSSSLGNHLFEYIHHQSVVLNFKIILFADFNQLPPINDDVFTIHHQPDKTITLSTSHVHSPPYFKALKQLLANDLDVLQVFNQHYDPTNETNAFNSNSPVIVATNKNAKKYNLQRHQKLISSGAIEYTIPTYDKKYTRNANGEQALFRNDIFTDNLKLCIGDRVMLTKNSLHYRNGQFGIVKKITQKSVNLTTPSGEEISVTPIKITTADEFGVYTQYGYPIKLAWSIVIHKCQSLKEKPLYMDLSETFAKGQTYTALSRVDSFENLKLLKPLDMLNLCF